MADNPQRVGWVSDGGIGSAIQAGASGANVAQYPVNGVDPYGRQLVSTEGTKPTFSAAAIALVPPASCTDLLQITAGAKTIRLLHMSINGTAGTAGNFVMALWRRPTASTGGTPATGNALPVAASYDSVFNPASTATLNAWTAVPTVTSTGATLIRATSLLLPVAAGTAVAGNPLVVWDFTTRNGQGLVLRSGVSACLNLNTASISSGSLQISMEWTEE